MEQGLTNRMEQGYSQPNGPGAGAGAISLGDDNRRDAWWNIPWRAFNLFDPPDRYALIRRVGAYIAVFFRGLITFAQLFSYAWERHSTVAGFLFLVALGLLGFVFVVCGLAIIVEAKGRRVVFGLALDRRHFDVFLAIAVFTHTPWFFGLFGVYGSGTWILMIVMLLLIDLVAWVCTWPAEGEVYV